jgi:L-seryl-tRNA(Ser) seleniumtransferase
MTRIPVWRMIAAEPDEVHRRADAVAAAVGDPRAIVVPVDSTVGGGSLPGDVLPSFGVALEVGSADGVATALREGEPAVVGRVADGRVLLDLRTIDPSDDERLAIAVVRALAGAGAIRSTKGRPTKGRTTKGKM